MSAFSDSAVPEPAHAVGLSDAASAALSPLRERIREAADREAEQIRSGARRESASIAADASAEAASIARAAATQGEADAYSDARVRSSRARRAARETVLAAQEGVRLDLLRELRTAVSSAKDDPRYPALLGHLRARAARIIGPGAEMEESASGGIIAVKGTRRLDLSLPALALRRAEDLSAEVSELWRE